MTKTNGTPATMTAAANNPKLAGVCASQPVLFGENSRYCVTAIHTRFDRVCWFVTDAEKIDPVTGLLAVVRQCDTYEEAVSSLQ